MITVTIEPQGKEEVFKKVNTVLQLHNKLNFRPGSVLVIRNGELLTPDMQLFSGDHITLRIVTSQG